MSEITKEEREADNLAREADKEYVELKENQNNNQEEIDKLKKIIAYLEDHPNLPQFRKSGYYYLINTKEELLQAVRYAGSFKKSVTSYYYNLDIKLDDNATLQISINRDTVCEKIVTWKCPDESLIKEFEDLQEK